jgi:hypothetical protein
MSYYIYSVICLLISIGLFTGLLFYLKTLQYHDATTDSQCTSKHSRQQDLALKKCGLFDEGTCYKGEYNSGTCVKKASMLGMAVMFGSGVFFIAFIVLLVIGFRHKSYTNNFAYHNNDSSNSSY